MNGAHLDIHAEVRDALAAGRAVVALESTLISHGLPRPLNLETARTAEMLVRRHGAVPATIGVLDGRLCIGLTPDQLERMAAGGDIRKASRRDLAAALAQRATAATTVAATMYLAHAAGIRLFATGGIGGVHPATTPGEPSWDVSADLDELARTPVAVVCAGAKSILDLSATLEVLETRSVPVVGYQTSTFPAFYLSDSGLPVSARVASEDETAHLLRAHWDLHGGGVVIGLALPPELALDPAEFALAWRQAEDLARESNIRGARRTPFLLARLAELTEGRSLRANCALIEANAALAARIAVAVAEGR